VLYFLAALAGLTIALLIIFLADLDAGRGSGIGRQLAQLRDEGQEEHRGTRRQGQLDRLGHIVEQLGERVTGHRHDTASVRTHLLQAGYLHPTAVAMYWGARVSLALSLAVASLLLFRVLGRDPLTTLIAVAWAAALGWIAPAFVVGSRMKSRRMEIERALPDALDMLIVCVEAGLGLNQALVRVAEDIGHVSPLLSKQMVLVNLEIRAGTARDQALRLFADRTGVPDVSSLVTTLIQTDRFGTSIAHALRVQAASLRTRRRQRAEEAAAKTAIKLVFPLVLFIFPALYVVILGPAMIQMLMTLGGFR
jgi:tight adherence protein C